MCSFPLFFIENFDPIYVKELLAQALSQKKMSQIISSFVSTKSFYWAQFKQWLKLGQIKRSQKDILRQEWIQLLCAIPNEIFSYQKTVGNIATSDTSQCIETTISTKPLSTIEAT
jgi:hypothetical protein